MAAQNAAPRLAPGEAADSTRKEAGLDERGPRIITRFGSRSKDWYVRAPGPDRKLVEWLLASRLEWAPKLSIIRNAPCECCGAPTEIARIAGRRRRAWCSSTCAMVWYNQHRPKVERVERPCTHCGVTFKPARTDSVYCSSACRQAAYRARRVGFSAIRNMTPVQPVTVDSRTEPMPRELVPLELIWMFELNRRLAPVWGRA